MKIIVAQSSAGDLPGGRFHSDALCAALAEDGHKVQRLDLPSIAAPRRALTNLASIRLLATDLTADALICLDAVSSALRHPRKFIVLLDDAYLADDDAKRSHEQVSERHFITNVLCASLGEACRIFALSGFAMTCLKGRSIENVTLLQPTMALPNSAHIRRPGAELLAMNPLDVRHRPELLIAALTKLPEPLRARWIAPEATAERLTELHRIARDARVEQRLAIDVRRVNAGEAAYLLANAAALVEIAPGGLAVGALAAQAARLGVPIITCTDGGAIVEARGTGSPEPASPDPTALAAAILAASSEPVHVPAVRPPSARLRKPGWSPLLKAIAQ